MSEVDTSAFDPKARSAADRSAAPSAASGQPLRTPTRPQSRPPSQPQQSKASAQSQQPTQQPAARTPDWQDQFLAILGNHAKNDPDYQDWPLRRNGFVVLAHGARSLAVVQELCHGPRAHTWNRCLTARYRIDDTVPSFGTAFFGLARDLNRLAEDSTAEVSGDLRTDSSALTWPSLARSIPQLNSYQQMTQLAAGTAASMRASAIRSLVEAIGSSTLVEVGIRTVILIEAQSSAATAAEWGAALGTLLRVLPERCGIVLSGAPAGFALPTGDPHYLEIDLSSEPEAATEPSGTALRFTPAALTSDRPARQDTLGLAPYAVALARLVLHRQTEAPLTIGVQAPWGKGKSTFMGFVTSSLRDLAVLNAADVDRRTEPADWPRLRRYLAAWRYRRLRAVVDGVKRPDDPAAAKASAASAAIAAESVVTVSFNAWRYQDAQQIWAGLAQEISSTLESTLTPRQRLRLRLSYGWRHRRSQLRWTVPALFAVAVLGLALVLGLPELAAGDSAGDKLLQVLLPAGSVLLVAWVVLGRAWRAAAPVTERLADYLRRPDYAAAMGYQHVVLEDLKFVADAVRRLRPKCRFVVFVDDLDRCSDDRIMEVLQAIHLLLGDGDFFVFLGIDSEMIYRAIRQHYGGSGDGATLPARFPESYLSKIIQLSFFLPDAGDEQTGSYLTGMFSEAAREQYAASRTPADAAGAGPVEQSGDVLFAVVPGGVATARPVRWQDVEDTGDELGAFLDFLGGSGGGNPRELKRLINVHRLVKIVLQQPGSWSGQRQRRLVLWLIVCAMWPDLVDDVIVYADQHPDAPDCLGPVAAEPGAADRRLAELLRARQPDDLLPGADLTEQGELRLAAYVSQLVRIGAPVPGAAPAPDLR